MELHDMSNGGHDKIELLVNELAFIVVDDDTAFGDLHGIPTAMTILSADPPGLMFQLKVDPSGTETQTVLNLLESLPQCNRSFSVEDGRAWISLYDVSDLDIASILLLLDRIANALLASDLALEPGCLRCGNLIDAQVMYVEGRATRLCPNCLADADKERHEVESQLNRGSLRAILGLPGAYLFVTAGWAIFWTLLDMALEYWRVEVIEINQFTVILICGLLAGVGYVLGWPVGATLRQSIATGKALHATSVFFILVAAMSGEILYVGLSLLRMAGVFDLRAAAGFVGQVVSNYSGFWIVCKLALSGAVGFFCILSASKRKTVKLDV
ncbi:MAG: hypothetical protein KDA52_15505 [Planctomycetaceae bacterium]|nr:hypothetical protein [Planctomycetaceae bacterium]